MSPQQRHRLAVRALIGAGYVLAIAAGALVVAVVAFIEGLPL